MAPRKKKSKQFWQSKLVAVNAALLAVTPLVGELPFRDDTLLLVAQWLMAGVAVTNIALRLMTDQAVSTEALRDLLRTVVRLAPKRRGS